jgi:hypothetical protein
LLQACPFHSPRPFSSWETLESDGENRKSRFFL